jgi:hypothetical protein
LGFFDQSSQSPLHVSGLACDYPHLLKREVLCRVGTFRKACTIKR